MREAVLAHSGEALASRAAFTSLPVYDRDSIIEFLKSLQILPKRTESLCVNEQLDEIDCPARGLTRRLSKLRRRHFFLEQCRPVDYHRQRLAGPSCIRGLYLTRLRYRCQLD